MQAFARKKPQIVKETAVLKPANGATYTPTAPVAVLPSNPNPRAKAVVSAEEVPQVHFSTRIEQDGLTRVAEVMPECTVLKDACTSALQLIHGYMVNMTLRGDPWSKSCLESCRCNFIEWALKWGLCTSICRTTLQQACTNKIYLTSSPEGCGLHNLHMWHASARCSFICPHGIHPAPQISICSQPN